MKPSSSAPRNHGERQQKTGFLKYFLNTKDLFEDISQYNTNNSLLHGVTESCFYSSPFCFSPSTKFMYLVCNLKSHGGLKIHCFSQLTAGFYFFPKFPRHGWFREVHRTVLKKEQWIEIAFACTSVTLRSGLQAGPGIHFITYEPLSEIHLEGLANFFLADLSNVGAKFVLNACTLWPKNRFFFFKKIMLHETMLLLLFYNLNVPY